MPEGQYKRPNVSESTKGHLRQKASSRRTPPPPSRQSCHGWYAPYWNAVLFILDIWSICLIRCVSINICEISLLQSNHSSGKNEGRNISGQEIIRKHWRI